MVIFMSNHPKHEKIPFDNTNIPVRILSPIVLTPRDTRVLPLKWHEQLEILHFSKGGAEVEFGSQHTTAKDGDIYIINPLQVHHVYYMKGTPVYDCIMIDFHLYSDILRDLCLMRYASVMAGHTVCFNNIIRNNSEAQVLLEAIIREHKNDGFAADIIKKNHIQSLIAILFRSELEAVRPIKENELAIYRYQRLEPAFQYIEEHYTDRITIPELADLCAFTPSYFCRLFKLVMDRTVIEYISDLRLSRAEGLLRTTDLDIAEIARITGFEDNCYFSRRFRRFYGVSPKDIRGK